MYMYMYMYIDYIWHWKLKYVNVIIKKIIRRLAAVLPFTYKSNSRFILSSI